MAELDFENESFVFDSSTTRLTSYNSTALDAINISAHLTENSVLPIIQVLGILFFQEVNGEMYSLKNGSYNPLAITIADKV